MIPLESCSPSSVHRGPRQQQITEEERRQRHARWERGRRGSWVVTNFQATWQIANRVPSLGPGFCQPQQGCLEPGGAAELPQICPLIGPRSNLVDSRQQPCSAAESIAANFREAEPRHQTLPPSSRHSPQFDHKTTLSSQNLSQSSRRNPQVWRQSKESCSVRPSPSRPPAPP